MSSANLGEGKTTLDNTASGNKRIRSDFRELDVLVQTGKHFFMRLKEILERISTENLMQCQQASVSIFSSLKNCTLA